MITSVFGLLSIVFGLLSVIMTSWFLGLVITAYLKRQSYFTAISHFYFFKSPAIYSLAGIPAFKWIVTKTIYRYLNKNIKISPTPDLAELVTVRKAMVESEVIHGVAFVLVVLPGIPVMMMQGEHKFILHLLALNVVLNLYPVLLQQYNKARLDKVIKVISNQPVTVKW